MIFEVILKFCATIQLFKYSDYNERFDCLVSVDLASGSTDRRRRALPSRIFNEAPPQKPRRPLHAKLPNQQQGTCITSLFIQLHWLGDCEGTFGLLVKLPPATCLPHGGGFTLLLMLNIKLGSCEYQFL